MALQKQIIPIPFSKGLDTKTDPKQVLPGKLLTLENGIFTSPGRIMKRNGFAALSDDIEGSTTITAGSGLANFMDELILLTGTEAYSYSASTARWSDKQTITNLQLSSQQIVRNTYIQTTPDVAIHSSGLEIVTYQDSRGGSRYCIIDSTTQEQIVSDKLITSTAIKPKPFVIGNFLVILYIDTATNHLMLLPVPVVSPSSPLAAKDIALNINISRPNYDAAMYEGQLYTAYNTASSGIGLSFVNTLLSPSAPIDYIGETASSCIGIAADSVLGQLWVGYHNGVDIKYLVVDDMLNPILSPTTVSANSNTIYNIALIASNGSGNTYYTQQNTQLPSNNFILEAALTNTGTVTNNQVLVRSVSIAGKPFTRDNFTYITTTFDSALQPTYFTIRTKDAAAIAKFSPGVGGGTQSTNMIPEACLKENGIYLLGTLQKDLLTTISGTVYTQTGVNVVTLDFINAKTSKAELGENLHLTGGILSMYDGNSVVEHGFNIYPENVSATYAPGAGGIAPGTYQYSAVYSWMDAQGQTHYSAPSVGLTNVVTSTPNALYFTGSYTGPTSVITVTDTTGLFVGQEISDLSQPGNVPANTTISSIVGNHVTVNNLISGSGTNDSFVISNPGLISFNSVFTTGSSTITASSATGLYVGMPLSDLSHSGNFAANTFITNLLGTAVTLNTPTLGDSFSPPGDVIQATTAGATNFYAIFFTGQTVISVGSTTNLFVGQVITDLTTGGNLSPNTIITDIDTSHNTITINQPTIGNSASSPGDIMQTTDGFSVSVQIPTLRLTQKKAPIRGPVVIQVYRTASDQTVFYLVSSITSPLLNDTAVDSVTFIDTANDAAIIGNPILYTTGGVIENIAAPAASYITTYQDRIILLPSENQNQWWYSKQVVAGSPVEFTDSFVNNIDQLGGNLVACLRMDSELVFWKDTLLYYITGVGPDSTGNQNDFSPPQLIASDVGCSDKKSLVLTPAGVFFKSLKGIYLLTRQLQLNYIGSSVEAYNQYDVVSANLIENTQQVRFCLSNGQAIVYDYYMQEWSTFTNISAEDSVIFDGLFTYLRADGTVLQETPGEYTDNGEFIKLRLKTAWLSFASLQGFQRVYQLLYLGDYFNPHNVAVYAAYDFNPFTTQQNVVQTGQILGAGTYGSDTTYGESTPYGGPPQTYQFRVNLNRQKCQAIQITIEDQQLGASFGENLALSAFSFLVGGKGGVNKIVAQGANTQTP